MKRLVDKTKESNIKCEHCEFFDEKNYAYKCLKTGKDANYWERCKEFEWKGDYLTMNIYYFAPEEGKNPCEGCELVGCCAVCHKYHARIRYEGVSDFLARAHKIDVEGFSRELAEKLYAKNYAFYEIMDTISEFLQSQEREGK